MRCVNNIIYVAILTVITVLASLFVAVHVILMACGVDNIALYVINGLLLGAASILMMIRLIANFILLCRGDGLPAGSVSSWSDIDV